MKSDVRIWAKVIEHLGITCLRYHGILGRINIDPVASWLYSRIDWHPQSIEMELPGSATSACCKLGISSQLACFAKFVRVEYGSGSLRRRGVTRCLKRSATRVRGALGPRDRPRRLGLSYRVCYRRWSSLSPAPLQPHPRP